MLIAIYFCPLGPYRSSALSRGQIQNRLWHRRRKLRMPRCRKSYRGSRSKAQVPGLSSFPLLIRSCRSFVPFPSVRSIDRSENFILSAGVRFFPPSSGLVPRLMFQLTYVSRLPDLTPSSPMRLPAWIARVPMFPNLNLLFLAKNSRNAEIQLRSPTAARVYA